MAQHYDAIEEGRKTFEIRKNDRVFQNGDLLIMHRFTLEELNQIEMGKLWPPMPVPSLMVEVTYIQAGGQFGVKAGYVVLGIKKHG
jgi:hypothetical protein